MPRLIGVILLAAAFIVGGVVLRPRHNRSVARAAVAPIVAESSRVAVVTDERLRAAADALLASVDPDLPMNTHWTPFAKDKLRWMNREQLAKRLDVAFIGDSDSIPPDVVMASTRLDHGDATILIVKRRFAELFAPNIGDRFLITQRQRNDFALALIHEVVHLQNPDANPNTAADYAREESRTWREVSRNVVRQLRALHQPMHQTYIDVDDAFVSCGDRSPCPALDHMVRLHHWSQPLH